MCRVTSGTRIESHVFFIVRLYFHKQYIVLLQYKCLVKITELPLQVTSTIVYSEYTIIFAV
jgi:hypothetical protein